MGSPEQFIVCHVCESVLSNTKAVKRKTHAIYATPSTDEVVYDCYVCEECANVEMVEVKP